MRCEAGGAERAVRAGVGREEDERVERRPCRLASSLRSRSPGRAPRAPRFRWRCRSLLRWCPCCHDEQRRRSSPATVPGTTAARFCELDPSDARDLLAPAVLTRPGPVQRELVAEPGRGVGRAERAGHPAGVLARQVARQRGRGRAVERRRKRRRGQRARASKCEQEEDQRRRARRRSSCARDARRRAARPSRAAASACSCRGGRAPCRGL